MMEWWTFATWLLQICLGFAVIAIMGAVTYGIWREFRDARDDSLWHRNSECEAWQAKMGRKDRESLPDHPDWGDRDPRMD